MFPAGSQQHIRILCAAAPILRPHVPCTTIGKSQSICAPDERDEHGFFLGLRVGLL